MKDHCHAVTVKQGAGTATERSELMATKKWFSIEKGKFSNSTTLFAKQLDDFQKKVQTYYLKGVMASIDVRVMAAMVHTAGGQEVDYKSIRLLEFDHPLIEEQMTIKAFIRQQQSLYSIKTVSFRYDPKETDISARSSTEIAKDFSPKDQSLLRQWLTDQQILGTDGLVAEFTSTFRTDLADYWKTVSQTHLDPSLVAKQLEKTLLMQSFIKDEQLLTWGQISIPVLKTSLERFKITNQQAIRILNFLKDRHVTKPSGYVMIHDRGILKKIMADLHVLNDEGEPLSEQKVTEIRSLLVTLLYDHKSVETNIAAAFNQRVTYLKKYEPLFPQQFMKEQESLQNVETLINQYQFQQSAQIPTTPKVEEGPVPEMLPDDGLDRPIKDLPDSERMTLYNSVDDLIKICIDSAFETRSDNNQNAKMEVQFRDVVFDIGSRSITVRHPKSNNKLFYKVGSQRIIANQRENLPDSHCDAYLVWVKNLLDDWASSTPESKSYWVTG